MTAKILRSALQTNPSHALLPERDKNLVTVKTCSWVIVQGNKNEMMIEIEAFYTDEAGAKKWKGLYKFIVPNATE